MNYLLDFDHTLMDTERLKKEATREEKLSFVGTPEFWKHYSVLDFLYPDVLPWLRSKNRESLHILTAYKPSQGKGAKAFQEAKIASGDFDALFESVTVMEGLKGPVGAEIAQQFPDTEPVVFIDDRLDQCLSMKESLPEAYCFLITRHGVHPEIMPPQIIPVSNLAEVDAIMKDV